MPYMNNFETEEDFKAFLQDKVDNLASMPQSAKAVTRNLSPGALINNGFTATRTPDSAIDPRLLTLSNSDSTSPGVSVAPDTPQETSSRPRTPSNHALTDDTGAHRQCSSIPTRSKMDDPAEADGHIVKPCTKSGAIRRSDSEASTQAEYLVWRPQEEKKIGQTSCATGSNAASSVTTGEAQASTCNKESVRWTDDNAMEWLDERDGQWKRARYHRDCRAELIAFAAQQPGAPVWTEAMGTDYTSFSPLTQGWTEDPASIVDTKGRKVMYIKKPKDWNKSPKYDPLTYNGYVILDHLDRPLRDIPGLPLTLNNNPPGWLLEGLRRCIKIETKDFHVRTPAKWKTKHTTRGPKGETFLTGRMSRYLNIHGLEHWHPRPQAKQSVVKNDHQEVLVIRKMPLLLPNPKIGSDKSLPCSAKMRRQAVPGHLQLPPIHNSLFGSHQQSTCTTGWVEGASQCKRRMLGSSGFDDKRPHRNPNEPAELGSYHEDPHSSVPDFEIEYGPERTISPTPIMAGQQSHAPYFFYDEMQTHMEQTWSFRVNEPLMGLKSLGAVSVGL